MDTQTVLGQHGAPFQIGWGGKTYTLSFRTQRVKAEIERWAKQRAVRQLVDLKPVLPEDEYERRMGRLLELFDNPNDPRDVNEAGAPQGGFAFGSARVQRLLTTDEGALALLRIMLGEQGAKLDDADLTCLFAERRDEIAAFFRASQSKLEAISADLEDDDPKALTAALREAGMW